MNLFSKLSTWYFSRKALPYWSIILLDCLVILFSGLLVYVNPAKRNVMVVKNEMRLLKQKRNVLQI